MPWGCKRPTVTFMAPAVAFPVFDSLTQKQHDALRLAALHLTSKQIALQLGVSPVTIDKRIEAVRARLGSIPRSDLVRLYVIWREENDRDTMYDRTIDDLIILGELPGDAPKTTTQPTERPLVFEDSISFDARASWERDPVWLRPGLTPSDLGLSGKLAVIFGGAVAILMVAVLSVACINALTTLISR